MSDVEVTRRILDTKRHRTAYLSAGPEDGVPMMFLHGFPGLGAQWAPQLEYFARQGWRCIAPDMRGYGGSTVPTDAAAYSIGEVLTDMRELHDALGGDAAVWVGHDWGSEVVWTVAAVDAQRCLAAVNLTVPYIPGGFHLNSVVTLIDRLRYPAQEYPLGQWQYMQFSHEEPQRVAREFEADVRATLTTFYRSGDPGSMIGPAFTATVRSDAGWFGPAGRAPELERDPAVLSQDMLDEFVRAYEKTGFLGPNAWYRNACVPRDPGLMPINDGAISLPVLFVHGAYDPVCNTVDSALADPMRSACSDLTELTVQAGHWVALEKSDAVNMAMAGWLAGRDLRPASASAVQAR